MENIGVRFEIMVLPWKQKWARSKLSWCAPIDISTHKGSKREKIRKKWRKKYSTLILYHLRIAKQAYYIQLTRCTDKKRRVKHGARERNDQGEKKPKNATLLPHTRAQCARTIYSNLVFLLSHLSHMQQNVRKQSRKPHQTNPLKRGDAMMPFDCSVLKYTNHKHNLLISSHF